VGYFSELDLIAKEEYSDQSYHGFEEQLLWRYEDLKDRYQALLNIDAPACGDDYFSKDDYRYAPIEYFTTLADVYHAMEIAKEDFEEKCNIIVREDGSIAKKDDDEEDPNKITMFEIVLLPTWFQTAVAA
jgi:hypothetical protein